MSPQEQTLEVISLDALLSKVQALNEQGARLVQVGATRLPEQVELTYSFDLNGQLGSLRVLVAPTVRVPSISAIYWCAFLYENEIHDLFELHFDGLAVDFKGNLYRTTVKFPFGSTRPPGASADTRPAAKGSPSPPPEQRAGERSPASQATSLSNATARPGTPLPGPLPANGESERSSARAEGGQKCVPTTPAPLVSRVPSPTRS